MTNTAQTRPADLGEADRALKAKNRAMWALGDYTAVATEIIAELGPVLVEAAEIKPGDRVLDVAAGTGNVAIPAALPALRSSPPTSPRNCWRSASGWPPRPASN